MQGTPTLAGRQATSGRAVGSRTRPPLTYVIAGMVVLGALYLRWWGAPEWNLVDLEDFAQGGRSVVDGHDIYAEHPGVLPFNYPPFGAIVFVPLALVGLTAAAWLMTLSSAVAYGCIVGLCARIIGGPRLPMVVVAVGGLALEPIQRNAVLGQVNLILLALVLVDIYLLPRPMGGLLIGVAAGIKLTPGFFAVYYLLKRDWASAARAVSAGLGTVALGWLVAPTASEAYWLGGIDKVGRFGDIAITSANQSLRGLVIRILGTENPPGVLLFACSGLILLLATVAAGRQLSRGQDLAAVLCLAAGALLASPISWTHHWVWVIPALILAFSHGQSLLGWAVSGLFFFAPMWILPTGAREELTYSVGQTVISAAYVLAGLAFLLCMAVWPRSKLGQTASRRSRAERG